MEHRLERVVTGLLCLVFGSSLAGEFRTKAETIRWFEGARFGLFIHWDPRSNVEPGTFDPDIRPEAKRAQGAAFFTRMPDGRLKWQTWNPREFDAKEWADLFVEAGARYFTFTAMHAFGFCNFDSPVTDFDIMSTDYKKDICAQLARAARGRIVHFWYFNARAAQDGEHIPRDLWPDYYKRFWKVKTYDELRARNIQHLITHTDLYGKVAGIWWDGGGRFADVPVNETFLKVLRDAQPWLIMNWRLGLPGYRGDWRTPEQRIPGFSMDPQWETCIPIEGSLWFWAGGKPSHIKDSTRCLTMLVMCATRDGNLLLNISPMPNGKIQPLQAKVLRQMGAWLKAHGQTIYGTRGGPYKPGLWGGSTRKGNKVFLHILEEIHDGTLRLPPLPAKVVGHRVLTGGSATVRQGRAGLEIVLDEAARRAPVDRIVELELDRDAVAIAPIETHSWKPITEGAKATASSEFTYKRPSGKPARQAAANVLGPDKGGPSSIWPNGPYWAAKRGDRAPWLEIDLGEAKTFDEVLLVETFTRIRRFRLLYRDGNRWRTFHEGTTMGILNLKCRPITARRVRIEILETTGEPPAITTFKLFGPDASKG